MRQIFDKAYKSAKKEGATEVEVFSLNSRNLELRALEGEIIQTNRANPVGVGIRVISNDKTGYSYTTDIKMIENAAANAALAAKYSGPDRSNIFPSANVFQKMAIYFSDIDEISIKEKSRRIIEMEKAALDNDERIKPLESVYGEEVVQVALKNSLGIDSSYESSDCWAYIRVLAAQNDESNSAFALTVSKSFEGMQSPSKLGVEAAIKAIDMLGAKKIKSQKIPVVLDSLVACQLLSLIGKALTADAVLKNKSFLAGKIETDVSSDKFSLIDDGTLEKGLKTSPFDDEGIPSQKTEIIKDGKLKSYLHNSFTAHKMGVESTGNGFRDSFKSIPRVSPSNLIAKKGDIKINNLLSLEDECFYILDVSGLHAGANSINGELSVGASGLLYKKGEKIHSVREVTIASDLQSIMNNIVAVADDVREFPFGGSCIAPSILVKEMTISGE